MAAKRVDPSLKVYAICGSTTAATRDLIKKIAASRKESVSKVVGEILNKWYQNWHEVLEKGL